MPTPDDAMLSPPAEREHESHLAGRATCPPEESRIQTPRDVTIEQPIHEDDNVDTSFIAPMQQPTPPPGDQESHSEAHPSTAAHHKSSSSNIEGPIRDIPTPISATDESTEEQRNPQVSPVTATAPTPMSWSQPSALTSPFPSQRVRTAYLQS